MRETKEIYPSWGDDHGVRFGNVKISDLHDFKEHPLKACATDEQAAEERLADSKKKLEWLEDIQARVNSILDI